MTLIRVKANAKVEAFRFHRGWRCGWGLIAPPPKCGDGGVVVYCWRVHSAAAAAAVCVNVTVTVTVTCVILL